MSTDCNPLTDCTPCKDCDSPTPVLPRCNNALPDGTYTNATVVVSGGCIVGLSSGTTPLYELDSCCSVPSSGQSAPQDCECEPGADGVTPQFSIGVVDMLPPNQAPSVTLGGSSQFPVLNFGIPACNCDGASGGGGNGYDYDQCGLTIEDGLVKLIGPSFTPITSIAIAISESGDPNAISPPVVSFLPPGANSCAAELHFDYNDMQGDVQDAIASLTSTIATLQSQVDALQDRVNTCCS